MGIARHKVEDHYRARLRAPAAIDDLEGDSEVLASFPDFESLLEQEQVRKNTWRVMSGLPEQYRLALIWRYWEKRRRAIWRRRPERQRRRSSACWRPAGPNSERGGNIAR